MLEMARAAAITLDAVPGRIWADVYVELRMIFHRRYGRGLVISTTHGADFFDNVIDCCEGTLAWDEKGELGENFRKMIRGRVIDETQQQKSIEQRLAEYKEQLIDQLWNVEEEIIKLKKQIKACNVLLENEPVASGPPEAVVQG